MSYSFSYNCSEADNFNITTLYRVIGAGKKVGAYGYKFILLLKKQSPIAGKVMRLYKKALRDNNQKFGFE